MSGPRFQHYRLLASLLAVALAQRLSPWLRAEEPAWFRLNGIPEFSTGLEIDGSSENDRISGVNSTYDTLFITPTIGLRTSGSIYHPNLLAFDFDGEFGWGWNQMKTTSPGFSQSINESDDLSRFLLQVNLLQEKPYNASFFASQDHTYRDYGSFDTYTVDSSRYGGRVNWNTTHLSLNTEFGYRDEKNTGLVDSSEVTETYFNFLGINYRHLGQTTLTARWDMFDNILNFGNQLTTMNESVGISDSETFGRRQQITASTGATLSHAEYSGQDTETISATENLNINHRANLDSYLILDFEQNYMHPADETFFQGTYGIRHQLYESLTSTLDFHGSHQENTDSSGVNTTDIYGVGLSEGYLKRLREWGRLSIGAGIVLDHQDDSSTGGTITSIDEPHVLYLTTSSKYRPVFLNRPRVIAGSVQVTASGVALVEGIDFLVIPSGELTEIRLLSSATVLPLLQADESLPVAVTYQSVANNNASFESLNSNAQIRLDLYNHLGIYARMNWLDNNAPPSVVTQTLSDLIGGVDYNWRWLRAGAEYEDYDSNFSKYTAFRFYQNFDFQLSHRTSLAVNFSETFYHYVESGDQTLYQFMTRYNVQFWSSLSWYVQGGFSLQDVLGTEQLNGSAQAGLNWTRGKLSVRTGYEYTTQSTSSGTFSEDRDKNRLFAYLKRSF